MIRKEIVVSHYKSYLKTNKKNRFIEIEMNGERGKRWQEEEEEGGKAIKEKRI